MKLIIQIPCYNEELTLPQVIRDLPCQIDGIDTIELLVIDDGSSDRTAEVASSLGVHHVVRLTYNRGLAHAFAAGLDTALRLGADIIVNTDGDNQYAGDDILKLVAPILQRQADMVIGCRNINGIEHFSWLKKRLQHLGSSVVQKVSGTQVSDTTSGFRAYSRDAAMKINVVSEFTYTLETVIQAGAAGLAIAHVPVETNQKTRESRLAGSTAEYVVRSLITILRIYMMYNPLKLFSAIAVVFLVQGVFLVGRFFYYFAMYGHNPTGHIQSLIVAAILLIVGFQVFLFALVSDVVAKNRKLIEDTLLRVKKNGYDGWSDR